ncbi:hypothetical protein VKT23_015142 [Stygiomarasmius scandens]|uniref:Uncharacterized protein n=1 Tax=Marasmiellus scandens TaxID=2682957 RepID=A0ABR1IYL4_9AGAR
MRLSAGFSLGICIAASFVIWLARLNSRRGTSHNPEFLLILQEALASNLTRSLDIVYEFYTPSLATEMEDFSITIAHSRDLENRAVFARQLESIAFSAKMVGARLLDFQVRAQFASEMVPPGKPEKMFHLIRMIETFSYEAERLSIHFRQLEELLIAALQTTRETLKRSSTETGVGTWFKGIAKIISFDPRRENSKVSLKQIEAFLGVTYTHIRMDIAKFGETTRNLENLLLVVDRLGR